ncbi:hypothetical protein GCK32_011134, partial [Trichostrongylus colubriformis]
GWFADGQCPQMNVNAIADPRQHSFRQMIFAVESSSAMGAAASRLIDVIKSTIVQLESDTHSPSEMQYSLIVYDDKEVRTISSTNQPDAFIDQFSTTMAELAKNENEIDQSLSLDVIRKAQEIAILFPTTLFLFTSQPSKHSANDSRPISRNVQVNVFTLGDGTTLPENDDLTYHQRETSGRNIPVTMEGITNLTSLLVSSFDENSLVLDDAAEDCSKSIAFSFLVEDVATAAVINVVGLGVQEENMVLLSDSASKCIFRSNHASYGHHY